MRTHTPYTPSNFIIIGHLNSSDDINIGVRNLTHSYMNITPDSYKFLESSKDFYNTKHKIRVYFGQIINDTPIDINDEKSPAKKSDKIYNHYAGHTFIIRPAYHKDKRGNIQIEGKRKCVLVSKDKQENIKKSSTPIPIFDRNNTSRDIKNRNDFEKYLHNVTYLGEITVAPWPTYINACPDGIIWRDNNQYYLYTNIDKQDITVKTHKIGTVIKFSESVSYRLKDNNVNPHTFKLNDLSPYIIYIYQNQIAFMDLTFINKLNNTDGTANDPLNDIIKNSDRNKPEGTSLYSPIDAFKSNDSDRDLDNNDTNDVSDIDKTSSNSDISTNKGTSQLSNVEDQETEDDSSNMADTNKYISNTDFIKKLEHLAYINDPQLFYNHKDLINFHTAMKCNGLVVLAGLSGTGKSALINLYAKALGIDNSRQFKFVPVRPFWNDDSDLLGYVDTVHSIYQPADSGLVNTLVDASNNHNKLYLITFDEMNLARVEYYFSQFLSILEKKPEDRYIQLYNPDLEHRLYNSNKYKAQIPIGSNVLFTGTINLDESTHKFSDKVLDRSNIIKLNLIPFYKDQDYKDVPVSDEVINHTVDYDNFNHMKDCNDSNKLTIDDLKLLWKIHTILHNANHNLGIGRRIINQINQYLCNLPDSSITHEEALDLQLVQRVFTKVRGSNADIGKILNPNNQNDSDNLIKVLSDSDCSNFTKSIDVLKRKFEEVNNYGFTI